MLELTASAYPPPSSQSCMSGWAGTWSKRYIISSLVGSLPRVPRNGSGAKYQMSSQDCVTKTLVFGMSLNFGRSSIGNIGSDMVLSSISIVLAILPCKAGKRHLNFRDKSDTAAMPPIWPVACNHDREHHIHCVGLAKQPSCKFCRRTHPCIASIGGQKRLCWPGRIWFFGSVCGQPISCSVWSRRLLAILLHCRLVAILSGLSGPHGGLMWV